MTRADLQQRIKERSTERAVAEGVALVNKARAFAIKAHGKQMYTETEPYSVHLEDVETVLIEFNLVTSILRAAAWLHDVVEDTDVTQEQLELEFPGYVAMIVMAVTSEPGKNRKERNSKTYPKIASTQYAVLVKLPDRISNGRRSKASGDPKFQMYKKEYPEFRAALYNNKDIEAIPMWWELDRLFDYKGV